MSSSGVFCRGVNTTARSNDCTMHHNGQCGLTLYDDAVVDLHGTQSQWSKHSFAFPTQYIPWQRFRQDRRQSIGGSIANININTDADGTFIHVYIRVYCWTCTVVCSCRQRRRRWLHSVSYKLLQGTLHVWVLFHITNILLLLLCVCMNVYHMHPGVHHHPRSTYYTCSS